MEENKRKINWSNRKGNKMWEKEKEKVENKRK